jgi:hypothetical protein
MVDVVVKRQDMQVFLDEDPLRMKEAHTPVLK